jgi:hypothetical protein
MHGWAPPTRRDGLVEYLQGVVDLQVDRPVLFGEGHGLLLKAGGLLVSGLLLLLGKLKLQLQLTALRTSKQAEQSQRAEDHGVPHLTL